MVYISFLDHWLSNHHSKHWSCCLRSYFGHTFQLMIDGVCFPWAYNIISFELTSAIFLFTLLWKAIRLEFSMNCRWAHQPPPHPLLGLMMNYCFRNPLPKFISWESYNVISLICVAPFLLGHPESEVSWHQSDLNLGQIWWLGQLSKSYDVGLLMTW